MHIVRIAAATVALALAVTGTAGAYMHAGGFAGGAPAVRTNGFGGSTSMSAAGASHTNVYGASTSANAGGVSHTNVSHTTVNGTTYNGTAYNHSTTYNSTTYVGGYAPPPPSGYYGGGCYNCGWAVAGAAVAGVAVGAAVASSNASASAATYNAGYAAGATATAYAMGATYAALPGSGCVSQLVDGGTYFHCGSTWFAPAYSSNTVSYEVVAAP